MLDFLDTFKKVCSPNASILTGSRCRESHGRESNLFQKTPRTTRFPQLQAQDISCEPNSLPLLKKKKVLHLQKATNPFSYFQKPTAPETSKPNCGKHAAGRQGGLNFQHRFWPFDILPTMSSHLVPKHSTILQKFCADHKLCLVSRCFITPSLPPNSRPIQS